MSRDALAEICPLPPSDTAISLKTASDTRVDTPCRAFLVLCRAPMAYCGHWALSLGATSSVAPHGQCRGSRIQDNAEMLRMYYRV